MKRFGVAALALGLSVAGCSAPTAQADDGASGLENPAALASFFRALDSARGNDRTVHILQIGDSHTANDLIVGALRERLQARYGVGGRGAMPPGSPYRGYEPMQVEVGQTGGWRPEASFVQGRPSSGPGQPQPEPAPPPFGLSGWRLTTTKPGETATLSAHGEAAFDTAAVCALSGAGQGRMTIAAGDVRETVDLSAAAPPAVCQTTHYPTPRLQLDVTAEAAPVSLTAWATFRRGGVALSNLGVSGTQLRDFAIRDDGVMQAEFDALKPDLIVLAYGTNDGYEPNVDPAAYEALLREQIARLRSLSHGAPILILGAPDANTTRPDIYGTGTAGVFTCAPLTAEEAADYPQMVANRDPRLARWYPPPGLALVRGAQRRAAAEEGAAYWAWDQRMGGACSAFRQSKAAPPLVRGDHVHFTSEGGQWIGGLLADDLIAADTAAGGSR